MDTRVPEVAARVLTRYVELLQAELPELVEGVYLYGSTSLGAFDEKNSDLDFLTVLRQELAEEQLDTLKKVHAELNDLEAFGHRLEGVYVPLAEMASGKPPGSYPYVSEGVFCGRSTLRHVAWWQMSNPVTVYGPALQVSPPDWEAILAEMDDNLNRYWTDKVNKPFHFCLDLWVAFSVLTLLRIRDTLEHRRIISKKAAAERALESAPQRWHLLIREALRIQYGHSEESLFASRYVRMRVAKRFARAVIEECNGKYLSSYEKR